MNNQGEIMSISNETGNDNVLEQMTSNMTSNNLIVRNLVIKALDDGYGITEDAKEELHVLLRDTNNYDIFEQMDITDGRMYLPEGCLILTEETEEKPQ